MIKKSDIKKRVKYCVKKSVNIPEITKLITAMIEKGDFNLEYVDDNWILPKNMACAIALRMYDDWAPIKNGKRSRKDTKEINKLYKSIS